MRADAMVWVQRVTGAVFTIGVVALLAAVVTMATRAETVPPLPIYAGILGVVVLILLAGACLALISMAISARQGTEALRRLAARSGEPAVAPVLAATRPFGPQPLAETVDADHAVTRRPRPAAGRRLVAER